MQYGEFQINQLSRILAESALYKYGYGRQVCAWSSRALRRAWLMFGQGKNLCYWFPLYSQGGYNNFKFPIQN